ncbi:MAG: SOS response-associated peptidase [Elusimicrobia bacterium]|nr:SOS response-associated peptidase [Elusimicrobiota bacterium]
MCSRYAQGADAKALSERFGAAAAPGAEPRWNLSGGRAAPVVIAAPARRMSLLRFGLKPAWAEGAEPALNARAETAADKPYFREAFRRRRALVPATAWFERPRRGADKAPRLFRRRDAALFAFAGLWEPGCFAILTVAPNSLVAGIHDRMPALLAPHEEAEWLDPAAPPARLAELLRPYPSELLESVRVSARVESGADDPSLVEAVPHPQGELF